MESGAFFRSITAVAALCAGLAMFSAVPASSQQDDGDHRAEVILYPDREYGGPSRLVTREYPILNLSRSVNSVRVVRGDWLLCEQPEYRGVCFIVERDTPLVGGYGVAIRSARPIRLAHPSNGQPTVPNPTVTGIFAQFHAQPLAYGQRIMACPTGAPTPVCAARTADQFCRNSGWGGSAREHMESRGPGAFLADVLCVRENF